MIAMPSAWRPLVQQISAFIRVISRRPSEFVLRLAPKRSYQAMSCSQRAAGTGVDVDGVCASAADGHAAFKTNANTTNDFIGRQYPVPRTTVNPSAPRVHAESASRRDRRSFRQHALDHPRHYRLLTYNLFPCTINAVRYSYFALVRENLAMWYSKTLAVVAALSIADSAHAVEFLSTDILPTNHPTVLAVAHMSKLLLERTAGRHSIRVAADGIRGSENLTIQQVRSGALPMARVKISAMNNFVPATLVLSAPFVFRSPDQLVATLNGPIGQEILAEREQAGLIGLVYYATGARSFYSAKRPITTAADLRGMTIRLQRSDMWEAVLRGLGARVTTIPLDRVRASFATGIIDASEGNLPTYEEAGHYEVAKFFSVTQHSMAPSVLVFSRAIWQRLPEEDRAALVSSARDSALYMKPLWEERELSARRKMEAANVQFATNVDRISFEKAVLPSYENFIKDPKLQDLLQRVRAANGL